MTKKPETINEYKKWLKDEHNIGITEQTKNYYNSVANTIKVNFENSPFWSKLTQNLIEFNDQFSLDTQYQLLDQTEIKLFVKSFDSFSHSEMYGEEASPRDSLYERALEVVVSTGNASTTFLQRKLKIGYARAASLIDELEERGVVSKPDGNRARQILIKRVP